MSTEVALDKLRTACNDAPASECPDALDTLDSLIMLHERAEPELREGRLQQQQLGMHASPDRAADNPELFKVSATAGRTTPLLHTCTDPWDGGGSAACMPVCKRRECTTVAW